MKGVKPISIRLKYEQILEKYHSFKKEERFENIFLSVITFMEICNLNPYTDNNELASIIALYYMLLTSDAKCYFYVSFIEKYYLNKEKIKSYVIRRKNKQSASACILIDKDARNRVVCYPGVSSAMTQDDVALFEEEIRTSKYFF